MPAEITPGLPLESYPVCVLCLGPGGAPATESELTKDHLIPREICDIYNPGLKPLLALPFNKLKIHAGEHWKIDFVKLKAYRDKGLQGVFEYIAEKYPRSCNDRVAEEQDRQIFDLFVAANRSITRLNGKTPRNHLREYKKVEALTREYVEAWIEEHPHCQIPILGADNIHG